MVLYPKCKALLINSTDLVDEHPTVTGEHAFCCYVMSNMML